MFLLSVYTFKIFYTSYTSYTPIYIHRHILTTHLTEMTEVWTKRRI